MTKTELLFKLNLKDKIEQRGITPYRVAKDIGMDQAQIYRILNMDYSIQPTFETLEKLAGYLKVEVYELYKEI